LDKIEKYKDNTKLEEFGLDRCQLHCISVVGRKYIWYRQNEE